jgi:hypothetical protein
MEGTMGHTPGPWEEVEYAIYAKSGEIGNFGQEMDTTIAFIADADDNGLSDAEAKANACLIAAAPDLLEACKDASGQLHAIAAIANRLPRKYAAEIAAVLQYNKVDSAIAKAKGEA